MMKMKDSKGNNTVTLGFVTSAFIVGTVGFIYSFLNGNPVDLMGYGVFITGSIFPWLVREYTEKVKKNVDANS